MEVLMDAILSHLLSFSDGIYRIIKWSVEHPEAAILWGPILLGVLNYIVRLTPWRGDDDLLTIVKDALLKAYQRKGGK
jgi:hypothetical protein